MANFKCDIQKWPISPKKQPKLAQFYLLIYKWPKKPKNEP